MNGRVLTENLLSSTDLTKQFPEVVGHIYPVIHGDSDQFRVTGDFTEDKNGDWESFASNDDKKIYEQSIFDSEHHNIK